MSWWLSEPGFLDVWDDHDKKSRAFGAALYFEARQVKRCHKKNCNCMELENKMG
jgi:hypothetical protein